MFAAHCSIPFKPVGENRSFIASLNKDSGIRILTSNAKFHVTHFVGDWSDSLGVFFEFIETCWDVSWVIDVGTIARFVPREVTKGGVFFLSSSHEVSHCLEDMSIGIGHSLFVWNWNWKSECAEFSLCQAPCFWWSILDLLSLRFLAAFRNGCWELLVSVRLVLGGDLGWPDVGGGAACVKEI